MDEFSAGIQEPGGTAGEKSVERSEIEIFDFVNQKPDLTTMDRGIFAEIGAGSLPKKKQAAQGAGPRYENAWEEIELRDAERRAEEKRRAKKRRQRVSGSGEAGAGVKRISGRNGAEDGKQRVSEYHDAEAGKKRTSGKRPAEAGVKRTSGKNGAEAGKRRTSGKSEYGKKRTSGKRAAEYGRRRTVRTDGISRERAAGIRIAIVAALVLICVLAGLFFAGRKRDDGAIPMTVRRVPASFCSVPARQSDFICFSVPLTLQQECRCILWEDVSIWE